MIAGRHSLTHQPQAEIVLHLSSLMISLSAWPHFTEMMIYLMKESLFRSGFHPDTVVES